jgi:hypothetical protein
MTENKIIKKYPNLFGEPPYDPMKTLICFGFEVDDGWMPILEELFEKIDKVTKENNLDITIVQVKEKFGSLRVYWHGSDTENDDISNLIWEAEKQSACTCEKCGKPGTMQTDGWMCVRCEDCK